MITFVTRRNGSIGVDMTDTHAASDIERELVAAMRDGVRMSSSIADKLGPLPITGDTRERLGLGSRETRRKADERAGIRPELRDALERAARAPKPDKRRVSR